MDKKLNFSIDYLKVAQEDKYKAIFDAKVLAIETENHHKTWLTKKHVNKAIPTLVGSAIVGLWNGKKLTGHAYTEQQEKDLDVLGYVPEFSNIRYEKDENGVEYLMCTFILWKCYHSNIVNHILNLAKQGFNTPLSMEIAYNENTAYEENGHLVLVDFIFCGLCLLGLDVEPAVDGAEVKVLKFASEEYYKEVEKTNYEIQHCSNVEYKQSYEKGDVQVEDENKVETQEVEEKMECKTEKSECENKENFESVEDKTEKCTEEQMTCDTIEKNENVVGEKCELEQPTEDEPKVEYEVLVAQITELKTTIVELEMYKEKYEKLNAESEQAKQDYSELNGKYQALEDEVIGLRKYQKDNEDAKLQCKADEKYAKYEKYVTPEEKTNLQTILFSKGFDDFNKELSAIVLPKKEAEYLSDIKFSKENESKQIKFSAMQIPMASEQKFDTAKDRLNAYLGR